MPTATGTTCSCGERMTSIRLTGAVECSHCDRACRLRYGCDPCKRLSEKR